MLTLLAQRRQLSAESIRTQLLHGTEADPDSFSLRGAVLYPPISSAMIDAERRDLQRELTLSIETAQPLLASEQLRKTIAVAGNPFAGRNCLKCI